MRTLSLSLFAALSLTFTAQAAEPRAVATARMQTADGTQVGAVTFAQHPAGVVVRGEFQRLAPGWHSIHVHEVGKCTPNFEAAGGHFNPAKVGHGFDEAARHAGDLPNFWVAPDGAGRFETFTNLLSIADAQTGAPSLFDGDGAAVVIHSGVDDYATDPAGASGERIACGVVEKSGKG